MAGDVNREEAKCFLSWEGRHKPAFIDSLICLVWSLNGTTRTLINQFSVFSVGSRKDCMSCTLGTFIQELFYLPLKKNHPQIFPMKTSKTLKSHMKRWCQCHFPRNPLLFAVWSPVQHSLPIWQLSLRQMAASWEGSLCVLPPGLIGLQPPPQTWCESVQRHSMGWLANFFAGLSPPESLLRALLEESGMSLGDSFLMSQLHRRWQGS